MKVCHQPNLFDCAEARLARRKRTACNGVVSHVMQCQVCGRFSGVNVKRDASDPPEYDRDAAEAHDSRKAAQVEAVEQAEKAQRAREYERYLQSQEWRELRALILQRDPICRGCLKAPSAEVHHMTYDHIFDEFAFELVGLCSACHRRFHGV